MTAQPALFVEDGQLKYRPSDPETSRDAAVIAIGAAATNRRVALVQRYRAGDDGLIYFELADLTGVQQTSIGKRRGELRDSGLVCRAHDEDGNGRTRPSPTNTPAALWALTARGIAEAKTIASVASATRSAGSRLL